MLSLAQLECPIIQSQNIDRGPSSPGTNQMMLAPGETAARVTIFKTLVWLCLDSNLPPTSPKADALTTRPEGLV